MPLDELTRLGKDDLQRYPELAKLYSQSAGLAAFLMDGEAGRYREPLVEYLTAVYAGRDDANSLSTATERSIDGARCGVSPLHGELAVAGRQR